MWARGGAAAPVAHTSTHTRSRAALTLRVGVAHLLAGLAQRAVLALRGVGEGWVGGPVAKPRERALLPTKHTHNSHQAPPPPPFNHTHIVHLPELALRHSIPVEEDALGLHPTRLLMELEQQRLDLGVVGGWVGGWKGAWASGRARGVKRGGGVGVSGTIPAPINSLTPPTPTHPPPATRTMPFKSTMISWRPPCMETRAA